ncbi:hypothetical protein JOC37_001329 [Desulfohalotomaculum tongense]|uniref:hypothetical protein n=1 Tax=Desulforadius tongensis TaxID=1216062 RepID=UPI001958B508|nr:hypothetical protein [Desulforadius tongensis]MBM7854949.1 hypothetical protein [Desulforadius tongensis]
MKKVLQLRIKQAKQILANERGDLKAAAWTLGTTVIAVAIILGLLGIAPGAATDLFSDMIDYIKSELGF